MSQMNKIIELGIGFLFSVTNVDAVDFGVGAKVGTNGVALIYPSV